MSSSCLGSLQKCVSMFCCRCHGKKSQEDALREHTTITQMTQSASTCSTPTDVTEGGQVIYEQETDANQCKDDELPKDGPPRICSHSSTEVNQFSMQKTPSAAELAFLNSRSVASRLISDFQYPSVTRLSSVPEKSVVDQEDQFVKDFEFGLYLERWNLKRRNSVIPKYKTLKEELTQNPHATITEEEFENLSTECSELQKQHPLMAKDIGIMNEKCNIKPGTPMSLDHMICVKFYTNFTEKQKIFKKHCRRMYNGEPINYVIERNRKIAHWCRLLKESIMFYGDTMAPNDVVYCGLNAPLIFKSVHQRFECPLSTTTDQTIATQFTVDEVNGGSGLILKLQRANPKTRYLNVAPFTHYKNEKELLFMGSTLKIVDIVVADEEKSLEHYVSTLQLFEQIVRGQFLTGNKDSRTMLLAVLNWAISTRKSDGM